MIYFILLRISSLYLPDLISALYLLPTNSMKFLFNEFRMNLAISLPSFPSEISIKYLLFESKIFCFIKSNMDILFSISLFSSYLYLKFSLKISLIFDVEFSKPPKFLYRERIPT